MSDMFESLVVPSFNLVIDDGAPAEDTQDILCGIAGRCCEEVGPCSTCIFNDENLEVFKRWLSA